MKFQLLFQQVLTDLIQNIDELKEFYQTIDYDTINRDKNFDNWILLTPAQIIQNKVGICYDTAAMSHYYLTKWNILHRNLFACTERNFKDHNYNDPTHTFTIYFDKNDKMWKWLEGSWEPFKDNNFKSENPQELINWVLKALANNKNLTYIAAEFQEFPHYGTTLDNFFNNLIGLTNWQYFQNPDR